MAEKFEQATTPDGIPQWEYTDEAKIDKDRIKKLCQEGWEPIGVAERSVAFKRPLKKKENTYNFER